VFHGACPGGSGLFGRFGFAVNTLNRPGVETARLHRLRRSLGAAPIPDWWRQWVGYPTRLRARPGGSRRAPLRLTHQVGNHPLVNRVSEGERHA
jgi:hypothetical protein